MLDIDTAATFGAEHLFDGSTTMTDGARSRQVTAPLEVLYVASHELVVVTKRGGGIDRAQVTELRNLVHDIVAGQIGPCKFLVFDIAGGAADRRPGSAFEDLITDVSDLIFQAPVVSIAWVRGPVAGADLELALACSMIVGEARSSFAFGADLADCLRSYALLAHRIGFVRAERLLEGSQVLDAAAMQQLMLLQSVVPDVDGLEPVMDFVKSRMRRHNSACGIYRAQRIAMLGA